MLGARTLATSIAGTVPAALDHRIAFNAAVIAKVTRFAVALAVSRTTVSSAAACRQRSALLAAVTAVVSRVTVAIAVFVTAALIVTHCSAMAELLTRWPIVIGNTGATVRAIEAPHLVGTDITVALSKPVAGAVATARRVISALPRARRAKVPVVAIALPVRRAGPLRVTSCGAARDVTRRAEETSLALAPAVTIAHAITAAGHQRCALPVTLRSEVRITTVTGAQIIASAVIVAHRRAVTKLLTTGPIEVRTARVTVSSEEPFLAHTKAVCIAAAVAAAGRTISTKRLTVVAEIPIVTVAMPIHFRADAVSAACRVWNTLNAAVRPKELWVTPAEPLWRARTASTARRRSLTMPIAR